MRIVFIFLIMSVIGTGVSFVKAETLNDASRSSVAQGSLLLGAWMRCAENKDCSVIQGVCGKWLSMNAQHLRDAQEIIRAQAEVVECDSFVNQPAPLKVLCQNKKCTIDNPS